MATAVSQTIPLVTVQPTAYSAAGLSEKNHWQCMCFCGMLSYLHRDEDRTRGPEIHVPVTDTHPDLREKRVQEKRVENR